MVEEGVPCVCLWLPQAEATAKTTGTKVEGVEPCASPWLLWAAAEVVIEVVVGAFQETTPGRVVRKG